MSGKSRISNFRAQTTSSAVGQVRDFFSLFGEDRNRILKLPWRAWDRKKTGTPAFDPKNQFAKAPFATLHQSRRALGIPPLALHLTEAKNIALRGKRTQRFLQY
jgi:hypothetical protein